MKLKSDYNLHGTDFTGLDVSRVFHKKSVQHFLASVESREDAEVDCGQDLKSWRFVTRTTASETRGSSERV
jgi:hypothetical protein